MRMLLLCLSVLVLVVSCGKNEGVLHPDRGKYLVGVTPTHIFQISGGAKLQYVKPVVFLDKSKCSFLKDWSNEFTLRRVDYELVRIADYAQNKGVCFDENKQPIGLFFSSPPKFLSECKHEERVVSLTSKHHYDMNGSRFSADHLYEVRFGVCLMEVAPTQFKFTGYYAKVVTTFDEDKVVTKLKTEKFLKKYKVLEDPSLYHCKGDGMELSEKAGERCCKVKDRSFKKMVCFEKGYDFFGHLRQRCLKENWSTGCDHLK